MRWSDEEVLAAKRAEGRKEPNSMLGRKGRKTRIMHRHSIVVSSFVLFVASFLIICARQRPVASFAPSASRPSPSTHERSRATTIRPSTSVSSKDTSISSSKPTTKASVPGTSNELLSLLQRKASSESFSRIDSAELDDRINSLVRALILSKTPFDPSSSIDGPFFASVHFIGDTPLWERIGAPVGVGRNVKGQRYTFDDGTFVNYAEVFGDNLYLTASGTFVDAAPVTAAADDGVPKYNPFEAMIASLFGSNDSGGAKGSPPRLLPTPYDYSATVAEASVILFGKFAFGVAIEGTGTVRVLYADRNLRIFLSPEDDNVTRGGGDWESRGLIVVQVRVDLVYDDWIDRL